MLTDYGIRAILANRLYPTRDLSTNILNAAYYTRIIMIDGYDNRRLEAHTEFMFFFNSTNLYHLRLLFLNLK